MNLRSGIASVSSFQYLLGIEYLMRDWHTRVGLVSVIAHVDKVAIWLVVFLPFRSKYI